MGNGKRTKGNGHDKGKRTTDNENKGQGDTRQRQGDRERGKVTKQKVTNEMRKGDKGQKTKYNMQL